MRYTITALAVLFVLLSCKKELPDAQAAQVEATDSIPAAPVTAKQKNSKSLDELTAVFAARKEEIQAELKSLSQKEANALYKKYAEENDGQIQEIQEKEQDLLANFYNYYGNTTATPDSIKKKENLLNSAGLELWEIGEGYVEIRTQHDFYYNLFKNYVTPDYREFLHINSEEEKDLYSADAGIGISWEELGNRVLSWENFLKKYPGSDLTEDAMNYYKGYQMDYLFGMDNTPTMEYSTAELYPENITEFKRFIAQNPDSFTSKLAKIMLANTKNRDTLREAINKEQESI